MEHFILDIFLKTLRDELPEHNIDLTPVIVDERTLTPTRMVLVNGEIVYSTIYVDHLNKLTPRELRTYCDLYIDHIRDCYDPLGKQLEIIRKEIYEDPLNVIL